MVMLLSIAKLELTSDSYVKISTSPVRYVSKFEKGTEPYIVINLYMQQQGWKYKDQLGSSLIFEKNNQQSTVSTIQYTKRFFIWTIPEPMI
ncbi:hypothetical protein [Fictibacillus enclensis]|uniref:hypothetical protein n=1 Tax=Fictibacillus enclensis TaxID=1017270 RepID=UPI0024C045B3|nr:hypothetical protein [Fictibacillus enclensis]WHY70953.1 hypothetical protein QNH15_18205 [Fictibacillus enclensis]